MTDYSNKFAPPINSSNNSRYPNRSDTPSTSIDRSYKTLGQSFGGYNHETVIFGANPKEAKKIILFLHGLPVDGDSLDAMTRKGEKFGQQFAYQFDQWAKKTGTITVMPFGPVKGQLNWFKTESNLRKYVEAVQKETNSSAAITLIGFSDSGARAAEIFLNPNSARLFSSVITVEGNYPGYPHERIANALKNRPTEINSQKTAKFKAVLWDIQEKGHVPILPIANFRSQIKNLTSEQLTQLSSHTDIVIPQIKIDSRNTHQLVTLHFGLLKETFKQAAADR